MSIKMKRKYSAISKDELEKLYKDSVRDWWSDSKYTKLCLDLEKVDFSTENMNDDPNSRGLPYSSLLGYQQIDDFSFYGVSAGGDWEYPLYFICYLDGKELRGYIPKKGNVWNYKTKQAIGNGDDDDDPEDYESLEDCEKIKEDIRARFLGEDKPKKKRFNIDNVDWRKALEKFLNHAAIDLYKGLFVQKETGEEESEEYIQELMDILKESVLES